MRANRAAFERWRIVPRVLRDVSARDTSVELFGRRLPSPLLLCADRRARARAPRRRRRRRARRRRRGRADDLLQPGVACRWRSAPRRWATRRAGSSSTGARTTSSWRASSARAEACGCDAIVVTLDTTMLGWRTRDLELGLPAVPARQGDRAVHERPGVHAQAGASRSTAPAPAERTRPTLAALRTLRRRSRARIPGGVLQQPALAARAAPPCAASSPPTRARRSPGTTCRSCASGRSCRSCSRGSCTRTTRGARSTPGMDGVIVSNHGGRQVDGAIAALDALPGVVDAVGGRVPVLLDSGMRGGADVVQGARARRARRAASAARTSTGWRSRARRACARCSRNLVGRLRADDGPRRLRLGERHRTRRGHQRGLDSHVAVVKDSAPSFPEARVPRPSLRRLRPLFALALSIAAFSGISAPARAQFTEVQPGARVRIQAPGIVAGRYVGTVLTRSAELWNSIHLAPRR